MERLMYLSFSSEDGWIGFCIVRAFDVFGAITESHRLGINPGGEVLTFIAPEGTPIPDEWINKLFCEEDDLKRFDEMLGGVGNIVHVEY